MLLEQILAGGGNVRINAVGVRTNGVRQMLIEQMLIDPFIYR
jgi:hypothetical protein